MGLKQFKCEYYQIVENRGMGREPLFDLERWIDIIDTSKLLNNTKSYKDDKMRIEEAFYNEEYELWFLRFMRLRPDDNPSLCGDDDPSEFLDLGDKYVSEDVTCLYDPSNGVIMIQKNIHSISPQGIEQYIIETWSGNEIISFRKMIDTSSFEKARGAESVRTIQVRLADVEQSKKSGAFNGFTSRIGGAIKAMNDYKFPFCELTFSVGRGNGDLGMDMLNPILRDIEENPSLFDKARVQVLQEYETKSEFIDLFTDSAKDVVFVEVIRGNPLTFTDMMDLLIKKYCPGEEMDNRKQFIDECLLLM